MSKKPMITVGLVVALVAAGFAGWYLFIRSDAPDAPDAETARDALDDGTTPPDGTTAPDDTTPTDPSPVPGLDGTWVVDTTVGGDDIDARTFVGYKVDEELLSIGSNTAFGRTPEVSGELVLDGTAVTSVEVEADLTALESDTALRDGALGSRGIETDAFPTASFSLTEPIDLGSIPEDGVVIERTATGELTLHGVTQPISIAVEAQLVGDTIAVTGVAPVVFADFGIETPTAPVVASVEDNGTMEIQLFFTRA